MPSSLDKNPDLAVGLKLPFGPGQSNFALNFTTVDQTKTNLMNLLLTQKGERFMQPNFGTDLRRILFEPNDERIESRIKQEIVDAVNYWLPFVAIVKVSTIREVKQIDEYTVNVIITFSLKADAFSQSSIQFAFGSDSSVEVS
jgi:phage baseplate assembly protein W